MARMIPIAEHYKFNASSGGLVPKLLTLDEFERLARHKQDPQRFAQPNFLPPAITVEWIESEALRLYRKIDQRRRWLAKNTSHPAEFIFQDADNQIARLHRAQSRFYLYLGTLEVYALRYSPEIFNFKQIAERRGKAFRLLKRSSDLPEASDQKKIFRFVHEACTEAATRYLESPASYRDEPPRVHIMPLPSPDGVLEQGRNDSPGRLLKMPSGRPVHLDEIRPVKVFEMPKLA